MDHRHQRSSGASPRKALTRAGSSTAFLPFTGFSKMMKTGVISNGFKCGSHTAIALPIKIYKRKTRLETKQEFWLMKSCSVVFLLWFLTKTRVVPNFVGLFMFIYVYLIDDNFTSYLKKHGHQWRCRPRSSDPDP